MLRCLSALLFLGTLLPGPVDAASPGPDAGEQALPGVERLPDGDLILGGIRVHRRERRLSFPAEINQNSGILEVLIATGRGRLHESLLRTEIDPLHLQTLLYLLGLENGRRMAGGVTSQGHLLDIDIEWSPPEGNRVAEPVEAWVTDTRTGVPMRRLGWVFVGSVFRGGVFQATEAGNVAVTYSVDDTVLDVPDPAGDDDTIFICNERKKRPGVGETVRVVLTPRTGSATETNEQSDN